MEVLLQSLQHGQFAHILHLRDTLNPRIGSPCTRPDGLHGLHVGFRNLHTVWCEWHVIFT